MPGLALSIEMLPTGLVPSLLKCPLYLSCLFCEQSESFLKPMTPSPLLRSDHEGESLVTSVESAQKDSFIYTNKKQKGRRVQVMKIREY